ncbi:MAG: M14 family zinc carboxypeptidase [Desulfobacterales bacterium]
MPLTSVCTAFSFDPASIKRAEITVGDREGLMRLIHMGVDVGSVRGNTAIVYASEEMLRKIAALGYEVTVIPEFRPPEPRGAGTYRSYEELGSELTAIAENYPHICRMFSIGQSVQKRELWVMKITDSPDAEEDEPEITFISSMHGDEPVGMELCMNLIHLLAENYGSDPQTELVNETEIWILPLMNPDGYVMKSRYNAKGTDPTAVFRIGSKILLPVLKPGPLKHSMS